jgi:hypothetical protein
MLNASGRACVYLLFCSSTGRDHRVACEEGEALLESGEIGLLPSEQTGHGVHEDVIGRYRPQTTRLFQGQEALDPPIALVTGRPS